MFDILRQFRPNERRQLTTQQISFFRANGYLHLENVLPPLILGKLQTHLERWVDSVIASWIEQSLIADDFSEYAFDTRLYRAWVASGKPELQTVGQLSGRMLSAIKDDDFLLAISRQLLDLRRIDPLEASFFRAKLEGQESTSMRWHQDAQCIEPILDEDFITLWFPLVDIHSDNSCLEIADIRMDDGMYKRRLPPNGGYVCMRDRDIRNLENKRKVFMRRGDIFCIHRYLPHQSINNNSAQVRWSLDIRYGKALKQ